MVKAVQGGAEPGYGPTEQGCRANGELTSVTTPLGHLTQWGYNVLGVKTSRTDALGRLTTYTLDGWNRVTTSTYPDSMTKTVIYDADSNTTAFTDATGTTARTFDADNRLLSESKDGSTVVSHTYDAAGRRASRTSGGVTTNFLFDGGAVLLEQQGGNTTATYTYSNSLIRKDGETPLFDGLGSERTVTNSGQGVMGSLTLSAFGQSVASSGSSTSAYQYGATSGYRSDGDAGLTQVGCRFYDAQVGRYFAVNLP